MKNIYTYYTFVFLSLIGIGCEDVINVEIEEGKKELVIDAWLNNSTEKQVIKLRKTSPYLENTFSPPVLGANVTVVKDTTIYFFTDEENDGNYIWDGNGETLGKPEDIFLLDVEVNGVHYLSISKMHETVPIDSITYRYKNPPATPAGYHAEFFAKDPEGVGNTYWIKTYRNNRFLNSGTEVNIAYDAGVSEGAEIDGIIFVSPIREAINRLSTTRAPYLPDDELRVEIHGIPYEAFLYLRMLRSQLLLSNASIFGEPPANLPSNIISTNPNANPQGFFAVSSVESLSIKIE